MAKISRYSMRKLIPTAIVLMLLQSIVHQALAAERLQASAPIRLSLTFVRANPVTTITVGDQPVQAIVDTGGDGAVTLSEAVIKRVGGVSLPDTLVTTNSYGQRLKKPRFRVPVVTIGGQAFKNIAVVQAPSWPTGQSPPVLNGIGRQFLSRYFVVLDFPHRSITLWSLGAHSAARTTCGRTWIPMAHASERELAVGVFQTQSGRVRLLFDTGATGSMIPQATAKTLRLPTIARGPGPVRFYESTALFAAGQDFGPIEFVALPLTLPRDFQGMLGRNFFMHHVVCLDYRRKKIFIR